MPAERDGRGTHTAISGLHRGLGRLDVVALTLNTIVGAGLFGLPSALVAAAGPWSLAVLAAAFGLIAAVALCAAEVASRFDATGGPVLYAHEALGPLGGFTVGWLLYLTRLATFGAVTVVMLDYAAALWPALSQPLPRALAVMLFVAAIAALNLRGVVLGAGVGNLLVVLKLLPLVARASRRPGGGDDGGVSRRPARAPRQDTERAGPREMSHRRFIARGPIRIVRSVRAPAS